MKTIFEHNPIRTLRILMLAGCLAGLATGCGKHSSGGGATTAAGVTQLSATPDPGTCRTVKIDGSKLDGDVSMVITNLNNEYFGKANETIYHSGTFPTDYVIAAPNAANPIPTEAELLSTAVAWSWEIEPKKDADGNWTLLTIHKTILQPTNGRFQTGYELNFQDVNYGGNVLITDSASGISINCSVPARK